MNKLQKSLRINAIFSATSGLGLILFHQSIGKVFEVNSSTVFWMIGIGLILFSLTILIEIKKQRAKAVKKIIIQDYIWVIGSVMLLIFRPFQVSDIGNCAILIIAFIVFFMAINQSKALAQTKFPNQKGSKRLVYKRILKASKSDVWKIVSDVANYHQVAPNIDNVKVISGKEEGMLRSCTHGENTWTETCTIWQTEKTYSFVVNTSDPDYPYPLSFLQGTWNLTELDAETTEIEMVFEFTYQQKILNFIHPLMRIKFNKVSNQLLDNWQVMIEE